MLFKEWVSKVEPILNLFRQGLRIVKWVKNHSEILKLFREIVPKHFKDKRKHCMELYSPGDTRMLTVFKMLHRIVILWDVLRDLINRPEYEAASQKALKQWSDAQTVENKLTVGRDGRFLDAVQGYVRSEDFKEQLDGFIACTKSAVYLHRLADGQTPVLGKFYYCCALVDKHLRVLKEAGAVPYIDQMRSIFNKRWKRWHRPIHTFAYALDPCYQAHTLSREERADCKKVIKKLGGAEWPSLNIEFDRFRNAGQSIFEPKVWEAADVHHGYQWWESFGDDFQHLQQAATCLLSKAISASACEFNWSDVSLVVTKKTNRLGDAKVDKLINVRAMNKLENMACGKVLMKGVPKIDDFLDALVNEAIEDNGVSGDDVVDAEELDGDDSDDDDREYENLIAGEDPLYELGGRNAQLEDSLSAVL